MEGFKGEDYGSGTPTSKIVHLNSPGICKSSITPLISDRFHCGF